MVLRLFFFRRFVSSLLQQGGDENSNLHAAYEARLLEKAMRDSPLPPPIGLGRISP
jgi:hypothetical protein